MYTIGIAHTFKALRSALRVAANTMCPKSYFQTPEFHFDRGGIIPMAAGRGSIHMPYAHWTDKFVLYVYIKIFLGSVGTTVPKTTETNFLIVALTCHLSQAMP